MSSTTIHKLGCRWLPNEEAVLIQWRNHVIQEIEKRRGEKRSMVIQEFAELIAEDPIARMQLTQMIQEIQQQYIQIFPAPRDLPDLLEQLNAVLTIAPFYVPQKWKDDPDPRKREAAALVGTPFSAILLWTMGTPSGFAAYRNGRINAMFKGLLRVWAGFLNSWDSLYVLNDSTYGWKSEEAQKDLHMEDYIYDPNDRYWGFSSWNGFFTRQVKPGARPIDGENDDKIVVAACDSTVYRVSRGQDVRARNEFWIKSQPYSLADMLNNEYVETFVGGDVWQAFLSPFNYHRWHSPVSGTIVKAYVKEGLYFSQATSMGEDPTDQDYSEGYIAHVQTRAIFFIEAKDPGIGLMCVMPVGMVEISSCHIHEKIKPGYPIKKGEELGYFQFGGSTHCLIFRPGAIREFTVETEGESVKFGKTIAIANG